MLFRSGVSGMKGKDVVNNINIKGIRQLITYAVNSDKQITEINTAVDKTQAPMYVGYTEDMFTKDYGPYRAWLYSGKLGMRYYPKTITKVFWIPDSTDEVVLGDEKNYKATPNNKLVNDMTYDKTIIYDNSKNDIPAVIVIAATLGATINYAQGVAVMDHMTSVISEATGSITKKAYFWENGSIKSAEIKDDSVVDSGIPENINFSMCYKGTRAIDLHMGDAFQYSINSDGQIDAILVFFKVADGKTLPYWETSVDKDTFQTSYQPKPARAIDMPKEMLMRGRYAAFGKVISIGEGIVKINTNTNGNDQSWNRPYQLTKFKVCIYNEENKTLTPGSNSDVNVDDEVFVQTAFNWERTLIILRYIRN